jgi:hypothetical protein
MVGRILFITFGSLILVGSWVSSTGDHPAGTPVQHQLASLVGIGFMIASVACGAAEGRRSGPQVLVPVQPPSMPAPPPQQWGGGQQSWPQSTAQPPYPGG